MAMERGGCESGMVFRLHSPRCCHWERWLRRAARGQLLPLRDVSQHHSNVSFPSQRQATV